MKKIFFYEGSSINSMKLHNYFIKEKRLEALLVLHGDIESPFMKHKTMILQLMACNTVCDLTESPLYIKFFVLTVIEKVGR